MDLSSMLNDGPPSEKRPRLPSQSDSSRPSLGPAFPQGGVGYSALPTEHRTPLHAPPPPSAYAQGQSRTLTPLHTPSSQSQAAAQYPFPQQTSHSPAPLSAHPQQYAQYDPYSASTPGPRPQSHGMPYAPPSSSVYGPSSGPPIAISGTTSHSPTPSSHHSQTPHSLRQSPLASTTHLPSQQHAGPPHYQQTQQPTTPLGPPQTIPRASSYHDRNSTTYHQRTLSGTSSSTMLAMGSPAQRHASIQNLVESPSALHRPSPQRSSTQSEYLMSIDRERSVSVSPKTKIPLRTPSLQSHSSLTADAYSSRGSQQPQPNQDTISDAAGSHAQTANAHPRLVHQRSSGSHDGSALPTKEFQVAYTGKSELVGKTEFSELHTSQKMDMNRLLTPSRENSQLGSSCEMQTPQSLNVPSKRPADSESPPVVPLKRRKERHGTRPVWAQLHPSNQRYVQGEQAAPSPQPHGHIESQPSPSAAGLRPNGVHLHGPSEEDVFDPLKTWEPCMCRDRPVSDNVRCISDWLWTKLDGLHDIGHDPFEGSIEIEAKIGTLIDINSNSRVAYPVLTSTILPESYNDRFRFESQMDEKEHSAMNQFLNKTLQDTMHKPGTTSSDRVQMKYKHTYETDSFRPLSDLGYRSLPVAFQRHNGRELKLRTTTDDKTKQVTARIVKIHIANLHIFSPMSPYDCRITINLEVNLNRADLDHDALTDEPSVNNRSPDRQKDRLSYKHLAYSIDLTKVVKKGVTKPSFELELEVDPRVLRKQMELMQNQQDNAFTKVVEGFFDNATLLMRTRPAPPI